MADKFDLSKKKCTTPEFRVAFPHVFKPSRLKEKDDLKYSITMLFPKNADLKELKRAANNAMVEKFGEDKTKWPKGFKTPFRDGNEKQDLEGYKDTIFVYASCKEKNKPQVVNAEREPIVNESEFYAGCYAHATLIAFYYDTAGNKGVSFSLQNILKSRDGKSFSGRRSAADDFAGLEVDTTLTAETVTTDTDTMGF